MSEESFHRVISDHMALALKNKHLERSMPLERYRRLFGGAGDGGGAARRPADEPWTESDASSEPLHRDADFWWDASNERSAPSFDQWGGGE
jgi:hypothetical protein